MVMRIFCRLFTLAPECHALGLITFTCVGTAHLDLVRMTFAGLIVGTGCRVAGNFRRLARDIVRIAGPVELALLETLAAGLVRHLRVPASYPNVVLATAVVLIVRTVYHGTV